MFSAQIIEENGDRATFLVGDGQNWRGIVAVHAPSHDEDADDGSRTFLAADGFAVLYPNGDATSSGGVFIVAADGAVSVQPCVPQPRTCRSRAPRCIGLHVGRGFEP